MKKTYLLLFVMLMFIAPVKSTWAQWLLTDDFSSPAVGTNINGNGWTAHSGAGTNAIKVTAPGLTYTGYYGSGVGNAVSLTTSGEDDNKSFTAVTSGTVYAAAMINVSAAQATGDYFFHVGNGSSYYARIFIKSSGAGFVIGASKYTAAAAYSGTVFSFNTTYLLVVKYTYIAGTTNDQVDLFMLTDPSMPATEPAATLTTTDGNVGNDVASISQLYIRQGTAANAATLQIDGIRVAASWNDLFFVPAISAASGVGATGFTANWGAVSGATKYYLDVATDAGFTSFVAGYNNADVGNVTSQALTGLVAGQTYYYRVRAYNGSITGINSASASIMTVSLVLSATEGTTLAYTENDPATAITSTTALASTAVNLAGAVVQITSNYKNGQDVLGFTTQNGISGAWDASLGKLTLSGSSAFANYETAIRSVTYQNSSESPNVSVRTVSFSVNDGTTSSNIVTRNISVASVNDVPALAAIEGSVISYITGQQAQITNSLTLSDLDNPTIPGATVQITSNYDSGKDFLLFTNQNGITGTWTSGTGTLALSGSAALADYQTAIRSIKFQNASSSASSLTRTVSFTINDGTINSNTLTRDIAVDNAPLLAAIESSTINYGSGSPTVSLTSALTVSDFDNANLSSAVVQFSGYHELGKDVLNFVNAGGITGVWTDATGTLALTGVSSVANYQAALRSITFRNISDTPVKLVRVINITVNDGTANSNIAARNIDLGFVGPTLSSVESDPLIYKQGDPETVITNGFVINNPSSPTMNSAIIKISGNYVKGEDILACLSQNQIISFWNAAEGTIELMSPSSTLNYQTAIRSITYKNISSNPSLTPRTIEITMSDGYNTTNTVSRIINISAPRTITAIANIPEGGNVTGSGTIFTGNSVTVTAAANTGYTFVNWTEGGSVITTSPNYTFTVTANRSLTANFVINQYVLNITPLPAEGGTVTGAGTYNYGSSVSVTAVPNSGYAFVNWTNGTTVLSTSAAYTFTLNSSLNLTANFLLLPVLTTDQDVISVGPSAGTAVINVANTGGSILNWTAVSDIFWIKINSGLSGINNGTISFSYSHNNSIARIGTITLTADGVAGSPKKIEVRQSALVLGIESIGSGIPTNFRLDQNYPNPFNPSTKIRFGIPQASKVSVVVYNVMGEEIEKLVEGEFGPGYYQVDFNAHNLSSGMYLYKITAGEFVQVKKMLLTK